MVESKINSYFPGTLDGQGREMEAVIPNTIQITDKSAAPLIYKYNPLRCRAVRSCVVKAQETADAIVVSKINGVILLGESNVINKHAVFIDPIAIFTFGDILCPLSTHRLSFTYIIIHAGNQQFLLLTVS